VPKGEDGWRDPDLPDGVVRFPPEPRPVPSRRGAGALILVVLAALAAWVLLRGGVW
jgi:hypothetical protein